MDNPQNPVPSDRSEPLPLREHVDDIRTRLSRADGLLLLTDFDGTLAPIVDRPADATMLPAAQPPLEAVAAHPAATVAVVSGRALPDLRTRIPIDDVRLAGNHGLELWVGDDRIVHPGARAVRPALQDICDILRDRFAAIEGVIVENKGVTASVHYRLADSGAESIVRDGIEIVLDEHDSSTVRVTSGKQVFELRPTVDWDKGEAVTWLREQCVRDDHRWVSMYVGDDRTDEAAFRALAADGISVKVGPETTAAQYRVGAPADVVELLQWLADDGLTQLDAD